MGRLVFRDRIQKKKKKLIDIGLRWVSLDIEQSYWTVISGILDIEVANPRQSTCDTKVLVDNYVDKSISALFLLYGIYCHNSRLTNAA